MRQQYISNRIATLKPSGIRKFFDIAATMRDVISLGIGEPGFVTIESARAFHSAAEAAQARRSEATRVLTSGLVGGSTLAAVKIWANGLRSFPAPMRPSAHACRGVVPRPLNGSRTTSPGREYRAMKACTRLAGKLARYEHMGWKLWPQSRCWFFHSGSISRRGSSFGIWRAS